MTNGSGKPAGSLLPVTRRSLLGGMTAGAVAPAVLRAAPLGSKSHIAVIGAGVFGAWTAHHLHSWGHRVTLIDARGPGNDRASSGGESRMTRAAYGKDRIYAKMARDSLVQWKALSDTGPLPLFHPAGVLFFFPDADPYLAQSIDAHQALGLPSIAMDAGQMAKRFPMIDFTGVHAGIFEPGFGALMARRAVQTLVERFVAAEGTYKLAQVLPPMPTGTLTQIRLSTGETISADRFVFALGPWLPKLFPALLADKIIPTRQEVFFFAPPLADSRFQPGAMPGWADFNGGDIYYGFPDLEGRGVKFAHDTHGVVVDPDTQSREHTAAALADVRAFIARRFPLLRDAPLTESRVCQYENSSNGDFLIDRHPDYSNVTLVGGGSGHGFKHGPEVGRIAAALALGAAPTEPRFTLATKAATQKREVH